MARKDIEDVELWFRMAKESGYNIRIMAKQMRLSRWQLRRHTQRLFGRSPQEWLNQQRLILAADLLREHKSVKVVAGMLGFAQRSHFSRKFKHHHGFSAGELAQLSDVITKQTQSP